ncbi:MAG: hypothetical protein COA47_15720, partial [Robiginitomaculum sp.]
ALLYDPGDKWTLRSSRREANWGGQAGGRRIGVRKRIMVSISNTQLASLRLDRRVHFHTAKTKRAAEISGRVLKF